MDFMMIDQPRAAGRDARRPGADRSTVERSRSARRFLSGTDGAAAAAARRDRLHRRTADRRAAATAIAFFSSFRDLTASGFWTTKIGIADLQYQGNVFVDEWSGCPETALKKLGVTYG